ncbi:plastocyanin/azurin family copper-binding protein [Marinagarivorans algicola]|uniref:plastocyanin/azurin family copper-binding protein n=1 Tax=Marinagarivorans algicola TaxID=1513270 RepID=UPI0006B9041B|nr:plastocyanin/azurin family copper-binding protein [Marinagarivorans algicola]
MKSLKFFTLIVCLSSVSVTTSLCAEVFEVGQKNKAFTQKALMIKVGDTVSFKNEDAFFHNVFSLSDAKLFDLGSYPQGVARDVTFDAPGEVEVECAVHPDMTMTITVQ